MPYLVQYSALHIRTQASTQTHTHTNFYIHSLVFSLRGRAGRNQSPVMWPVWLWHTASWTSSWPGVAQKVGRDIALLFHDCDTRRGWVVSSTPRPHFTPGNVPVPILQEAGWAPGPVWTGGKSHPHRDSIPDRPACSQSLYRLSYPPTHSFIYFTKYLDKSRSLSDTTHSRNRW